MSKNEVLETLSRFQLDEGKRYRILRIGVFGSVARGEISPGSDVDVVVELKDPDLLALVGIKQDLETLLERPVDVIRYREKMNAFLKQRIDREAIYA